MGTIFGYIEAPNPSKKRNKIIGMKNYIVSGGRA